MPGSCRRRFCGVRPGAGDGGGTGPPPGPRLRASGAAWGWRAWGDSWPPGAPWLTGTTSTGRSPAARPRIAGQPLDLSQYGTIYLGYPIWWGTAPRIINTFLDTYDLTGKTIRPFCTSGSSGIETSVADIRAAAPEVNVTAGLRVDDPDGSALKAWVLG